MAKPARQRVSELKARRRKAKWHLVEVWVPTAADALAVRRVAADRRRGDAAPISQPIETPSNEGLDVRVGSLDPCRRRLVARLVGILEASDDPAVLARADQRLTLLEDFALMRSTVPR